MSTPQSQPPTWDDVVALVTQLDGGEFADVDLQLPGFTLRMSRTVLAPAGSQPAAPEPTGTSTRPAAPSAHADASDTTTLHQGTPSESAPPPTDRGPTTEVAAPVLGVFYGRPSPDAAPFVTVGDVVATDTTVAIVEVMKLMNQVTAGVAGTITEICVSDGELVEFEQPLFRVAEATA
ncbi:hypothetical protein GCU60_14095 [Blastococcus saxobsidens]|uniref:Biotin carboxyl carrier protein of acetyl-CoA carboxylase n=1 Tax=Blastococcus saxobsidens TaxID=138336 RepID=A0A6L9W4C3_9ACTN|nr:biotin/lipoyl-containing protein [Blastococcus saxobsidens]NEK86873.1 hypothetical protein [Blastococcus saxobsidens]